VCVSVYINRRIRPMINMRVNDREFGNSINPRTNEFRY
jgi:hypothetical protein